MPRRLLILLITLVLAWTGVIALYGQQTQPPAPRVGCRVDSNKIFTGGSTNFTIFVDQMPPLTAYTLTLFYSPLFVEFRDQNQDSIETNLAPGSAFPANAISRNIVDPARSEIQLAVSVPVSSSITGQCH